MNTTTVSNADQKNLVFPPLPNEVFFKKIILPYLSPENIVRLLLVNRNWYQGLSSDEVWENLCPRISVKPAHLPYLILYPHLTGIHFARNVPEGNIQIVKQLYGHDQEISGLDATEKHIISASDDNTFCLWDRAELFKTEQKDWFSCRESFQGHREKIQGIRALAPIGQNFVIIGSGDKNIYIKNPSGDTVKIFVGHENWVSCLKVRDQTIISGSYDQTIRVWNQDGSLLTTLHGHGANVTCLEVVGEETIISGSDDRTIRIWNQTVSAPLHTLTIEGHVTCVKATDRVIVAGSDDHIVRVWKEDYTLQHTLQGHKDSITCLEIIDNIIAAGSKDGTIRFWNILTGQLLHTYELKSYPTCMKFSQNLLLVGSRDGIMPVIQILSYLQG